MKNSTHFITSFDDITRTSQDEAVKINCARPAPLSSNAVKWCESKDGRIPSVEDYSKGEGR